MDEITRDELVTRLERLPRQQLAEVPTPLQDMERFSAALGGPRLLMKRDDLTGLAFGGNKVRQMEYFIGAALAQGADVLIGGGGYAQSNHARMCAAAARAVGIEPVIVVRPATEELGYVGNMESGNALLTSLFCEDIRVAPSLEHASRDRLSELAARVAVFEEIADEYRARGKTPYVLTGTSVALGVMGYVAAALELQDQFDELGLEVDYVAVTSLGVTQAGLELASRALRLPWSVVGLAYMRMDSGPATVARLAGEAASLLGMELTVDATQITSLNGGVGPSYGVPTALSVELTRSLARSEGVVLDPVYTATGMASLANAIHHGQFTRDDTVVFVHTGGLPALFAYGAAAV